MQELIMIVFVFFIIMGISTVLNILFKMTKRRDWYISFLLSVGLTIIIAPIMR